MGVLLAGIGPLGRPASFSLVSRGHSRPTRILTPGLCRLTGFSRLGSFSSTNQMVLGYCYHCVRPYALSLRRCCSWLVTLGPVVSIVESERYYSAHRIATPRPDLSTPRSRFVLTVPCP